MTAPTEDGRPSARAHHERYAEEVVKGLHDKKKARTAARAPKPADVEGLF